METQYDIAKTKGIVLIDTCISSGPEKWDQYMKGTVKANGKKIRLLIKKHLPDLYNELTLQFYNPYEKQCYRKEGLLVYTHSMIEYFIKIN